MWKGFQNILGMLNRGFHGTGRPIVPLSRIFFSCPSVPLSWDKGRSKNPGTNSSVPGRPRTKWISIYLALKTFRKKYQISCFRTSLSCFRRSFSCYRMPFSALSCFVSRDRMGQAVKIWYSPIQDFYLLSRPVLALLKILSLSRCPFVLWQWRNFYPFVPKSWTVPSHWKP